MKGGVCFPPPPPFGNFCSNEPIFMKFGMNNSGGVKNKTQPSVLRNSSSNILILMKFGFKDRNYLEYRIAGNSSERIL